MARLISRTQVEEIQDFIRDTSFAQNVTISGSLLVSQSFSMGSDPDVVSDITGSVFITGSLTIDGPLNVTGDQALNLTASVSLDALDTQRFGGIKPEDFGAMDATLYVSSTSGDDNNDGRTQQFPLRTIKRAAEIAASGDDGRFGLPTGSLFTGFRIEVGAGTYLEDNPIELPKNTTVWGAGLRVCKVLAKNENEDLFWVNSGNYLAEMTFGGLRVFPSVDNSRSGFAVAFAPNAFITTSPYVQNCSMISNQENSFLEAYEDIPPGGGGLNVDGNIIHPDSPLASMVLDAYTQVAPNGVGCQVVGRGFIQLVSFFTNFSAYAVKVLDGGQAVLLNSNTSFGDYGMYSSGSRFITGSGGNIQAFNRVRDNYTIIIDTIEDGLSAIPEFVPNTNDGIKVTDELQYFINGSSSDEVAEQAKSEYRLVSNIVDSGVSNIPSLLAKSSTRGYSSGSVWNISYGIQTTGSTFAGTDDVSIISDRFQKVKETLELGARATASYTLVDNIDALIKTQNVSQYKDSDAGTSSEVDNVSRNFDTILKIVEYGINDADNPIASLSGSNDSNIKVTETPQFITDISSSAEVRNKISSSFATVYRILEKGTDYAPNIVQSSSFENPSIDYQNGYNALLGNLSFIQEETIAYLSSSWSTFDYNEVTCKRDLGYIVSGAAHDLLYGGNEESVRNGNFYYLYPSEATSSQKQQTLDAIKYAGGLAERVIGDVTYVEPSVNVQNSYDLLVNNKEFIQEEVVAYVSSSWRGFDYNEDKCKRDVGHIIDAVTTDLRYGGNERSRIAGEFYYLYPSEATTTQLLPTLDGIRWAKNLSKKLILNETFVTASAVTQSVYDLIVNNRDLIQEETVNFIDTQFPNLVYLRDKCKRDTGYIVDAVATDYLYGGNEKSVRAGLYYGQVPSKVNGEQLNETLDGIHYAKTFVEKVIQNQVVEIPEVIDNTYSRIRAGNILPVTSSLVSGSESERIKVSSSFGLVEDIIKQGEDSLLAAIAGNTPNFNYTINEPKLTTSGTIVTSSADTDVVNNITSSYKIITDIITNGLGSTPSEVTNWTGSIKVTDTNQFINGSSVATTTQGDLVSSSISIVKHAVENGTGSLPTLVDNTQGLIKVTSETQFTTSSISASIDDISFISESFEIVTRILQFGSGSYQTASLYGSEVTTDTTIAAYNLIKNNITFIQEETIAYLSSSWSTFDYDEVKCKRDVGYIVSGAAEDLLHNNYSSSIVNGKFYLEFPSNANIPNDGDTPSGAQLNQTLDGIRYAARLTKNIASNKTFVSPSQAVLDAKELLEENKQFIKDEVVEFVSSSWSEFSYNQTTCKRDVGYILDATITDLVYGGNERSRVAAEYYYRYPSSAIVGGVPSTTQQKDPTVDAIEYLGGISSQIVVGEEFVTASSDITTAANLIRENRTFIQQNVLDYVNYIYPTLTYNKAKCFRDIGFITDAIVTDLVYGGNERSIQAGTFYYKFPSQATGYQLDETISGINYGRDLTELIIRGGKQVEDSFDTVVKIIESGSSVQTDTTIGFASNGLPISQVGIPKNSYGDNLITTTTGVSLPNDIVEISNMAGGIKFNNNSQYTSSISASSSTSTAISESFRTVIDIIDYGISGSKQLSGSADSSSYFEVVTLPNDSTAFYITDNQLKYFDGRESWDKFDGAEDTGSFLGSKKDPTLTLVRNEMYNFSINDLGEEDSTIYAPFLIKTKRTAGTREDVYESVGLINNGISFGTITFTPLADTPDTLYYVNPTNVSASGVINIVDSLPLSSEQEYVYVPTKGEFEKVLNTAGNIKIVDNEQYTSSLDATISDRNNISGSISAVINILQSGSSVAPSTIKTIDGLIKRSGTTQVTSSLSGSSNTISKISSSFAIVLDIIENGTGSLPTQVDNTNEYIAVGTVSQFTTSSISASIDDISFISESFEIVARMVEFGTGSYQTASLYGSRITTPQSVAAYNLIKENIDFIQEETISYLSSSWSTFEYNEASCSRDIGYIVSGAAEDLIHNVYSASIVNGKFYYEFPSEATASQLNQTLDGIRYASRLAQNIASNITYGSPSQDRLDTETIIRDNINFIKDEAITFLSSSWSAFDYNETTCKRDIGYILDAAMTDIVYGGNERSINAGVFYYKYPSEATGSQLFPTLDGIEYAGEVAQKVVSGAVFIDPSSDRVNAYNLVHENRDLIQDEVIQYISSSWNSFDYDDVKCRRDTGYILDAATTDLIYGGNQRSIIAGDFYYRYPSQATGSQLNQTVDGIVYAQRLSDKMMTNTLLVTASSEIEGVYQIIERNRELVQDEVISYISSSWVGFEYNQDKCHRDVGHILDAVATDLRYGGNERSVIAGEYYWRYPSDATDGQKIETIDGIVHAANVVQKLIQNVVLQQPSSDKLEIWNLIRNNRTLIQNETTEYIDFRYPFFTYNREKCRRDVGHILDGIATDLLWGGNQRSVKSGEFYYLYPSEATTVQIGETIAGIRYAESFLKNIIINNSIESPSIVSNTDGNIKVTSFEPTLSSIALSGSYQTEVSKSVDIVTGIIKTGIESFTPTTATYNPADGDFVMTISKHGLSVGDSIYLQPESFTFTCEMDGNRTEHNLPSVGQPAYDNRLTIKSKTDNTITVNVGKSGPNVEFNPTTASYDPATGDFVVTVASHSLSVGEGIVMEAESFAFTCDMDDNQSVKSYPRVGIDPKAVRSIPLTAVTDTTMTFNVGASGPNKYFTPVSASYNALSGDMTLTVTESFGLGVGRSVVLEDESFAFTCDQDGDATTHSYPRPGSDPYAGKSIVITSVGTTSHTVTDAPYDASTGDVTITISNHGFSNGDYIKLDDNSLTYTCVLDGNTTTKSYPRPNYDYPSGRWLEISNVTTNTFDINIGSSPYVGAHTFVSATSDGLERQDGTFTINVGNAGSASGSLHTFVSASNNAVKHEPQSVHTFVSASNGALKHLPQSAHTFVRTQRDSVSTLPVLTENIEGLVKITDTTQFTSANSGSDIESAYVTRSVGFINDIIRLGTDDIPFALAKWYDDTLDVPQNLTTGSYVTASGTYTTDTEFGIVSSSFGQIINIIENGTGSLPTLETNTSNHIKVTNETQFVSSISGSSVEVSKVNSSVGIVENVVQNGLSVLPTITYNNSDVDNLIKVTDVSQITSESFGDRLQQRLISSSISVVTTILENGTGSLPTIVEYDTPSESPKTLAAYNLLKDNIGFIQSESIAYLSSSWSTFDYNQDKCARDIGYIISGAAEDMLHNANSASVVNGKFYYEYPSEATGSQLQQTLDGIKYAGRMAENIVRGYTYQTASVLISGSVELIRNNKEFIQEETIAFISSSWDNFDYNSVTCKRDVGYILDAVATDLLYGGNERSVVAGRFYYDYPSAAIVGGVPSATRQKDPTVTAIDFVQGIATEIVSGAIFVTSSNEVKYVYNSIRENREFIQNETIAFVNAKYPNFEYNEASCSRDTGFIVDAVATDLRWGGNQRALTAGEFYYRFPSEATNNQLDETTDALIYAKDLIEKIIDKETLFVPTGSLNTDNAIKVTNLSPATGGSVTDISILNTISSSFAIVSDAIANGTGSTPTASLYGPALTDSDIVTAHALITASVPFIQTEVVEYISSSWVGFDYDDVKCARDVGYIVNGVASDLLYGVVSASVVNAKYYYEFPSEATSSQSQQTIDGINYAYQLTEQIVKGVTFTNPSTQLSASVELIRNNREFIQSESISYLSSSWEGFEYVEATCRRDVGHIVDAVATDLLYGGNQRSKIAGEFYYKYPSSATSTQLEPTTTGIKYAGDVASKLVQNEIFVTASAERLAGNKVILDNKEFIQNEVIAYISSSWSTFDYNEDKCKRDTGYILNGVATDFLYGGNERSRVNGEYYYLYPSNATVNFQNNTNGQLNQTIDGINYASSLAQKVMENTIFVTASAEVSGAVELLRNNRSFIQNETIEFISSSWSNVTYNEDKCRRDTGYIVDAAVTDLLYGGNERSVTAGLYYWRYPSRATQGGTPSEANQLDPTVDGIRFANGTSQNIVQNLEYSQPSVDILNGIDLLRGNTTFIQKETIAYLSSSWSEFEYNEVSCSRDLGYIIDAVATDLKYGGNERAVQAGTFYYYIPSIATTEQKPQTTDGIDFSKGLAEKVITQKQLVFPFLLNKNGANALRNAKKTLQGKAISYTNAAFPNFEYNEEKCYRDTGFIVDAIATDIIYGGNERSIRAAQSYYNGVYGSAAVVINEQKKETAETNRYLRTQFQFIARQAPVEEFGSLIITTGHDFSYAGSGVTYKALPPNQGGDGIPDPSKEVVEVAGGRVFFTSGNELGDFRIGAGLIIKQASGTLEGRTFSRSLFSLVTPFSLALQD